MMTKKEYFYDETGKHIRNVQVVMSDMIRLLMANMRNHDVSKYSPEEADSFAEITPELANVEYGSEEYKENLRKIKPALEHHQRCNAHHPEHFKKYVCNGCFTEYYEECGRCKVCGYTQRQTETDISQMSLTDLLEMLADWMAASTRNPNGDIIESIKKNQKRFGYSDELKSILINTARDHAKSLEIMEGHHSYDS